MSALQNNSEILTKCDEILSLLINLKSANSAYLWLEGLQNVCYFYILCNHLKLLSQKIC